ncbi:hypothetical protein BgiBS90_019336, partial [Biomphalaria glabrata]
VQTGFNAKKKMSKCWIFLFLLDLTRSQTITFQRNDGWSAPCGHTFIHNKDQILITSRINTMGFMDQLHHVRYEIKTPSDNFRTICYLDLESCNLPTVSECSCQRTDVPNVFDAKINFTAHVSISEATIRGKLTYSNHSIFSEEIKIPKIYDFDRAKPIVYINNQLADIASCNLTLKEPMAMIVLVIDKIEDLPCRSHIMDPETRQRSESETNVVTYSTIFQSKRSFTLGYQLCNSRNLERTIYCHTETDELKSVEAEPDTFNFFLLANTCILVVLLLMIVILILWLKRYRGFRSKSKSRHELSLLEMKSLFEGSKSMHERYVQTESTENSDHSFDERQQDSITVKYFDIHHKRTGLQSAVKLKKKQDSI